MGNAALDVGAVALEHAMRCDAHENVEIARCAAAGAGLTLAREADARAVLDAVRNLDGQRLFAMHPA